MNPSSEVLKYEGTRKHLDGNVTPREDNETDDDDDSCKTYIKGNT